MKLISLNTWSGRAGNDILSGFFSCHKDVDVFCFQEIWEGGQQYAHEWGNNMDTNLLTNINNVLNKHVSFFRPNYLDWWGLAISMKKNLVLQKEGELFVYKKDSFESSATDQARNIQYATFETENGLRTIVNFHGIWTGKGKGDTNDRLRQSDNIIHFLETLAHPYILCGDFNLSPDTQSLKKLESIGMRNLIKEHRVMSTRSSYYKKTDQFADYVLVSDGINVKDFKVLPDEVSDHLAMYLDFE